MPAGTSVTTFELDRSEVSYGFDKALLPRLRVPADSRVRVQTHDARSGKLRVPEDVVRTAPALGDRFPRTNPATGPIWIEGAQPGDELAITIEAIELDALGFIIARPEWGTAQGIAPTQVAKMLPVENDLVRFNDLLLPVRPNVGVLATAPAGEPVSSLQMGDYGGNMDCNAVCVGTTVHLPVFVEGALLFIGDVHATMGDAEPVGTGCEIDATVTARIELLSARSRGEPWMESATHLIGYGSGGTFRDAAERAMRQTLDLLVERTGMSRLDAYMLIGLIGDVRVNQACNAPIDVGVRVEIPKEPWMRVSHSWQGTRS